MQEKHTKNQFLYLLGPLLIKWVIEFLVQGVAGFIYMAANYSSLDMAGGQSELMKQAMTLATELSQYAAEMSTVAAVLTIPIMWHLFRKDRAREPQTLFLPEHRIKSRQYAAVAVMGICVCIACNNLILLSSISSVSQGYRTTSELVYQSPFLIQLLGLGVLVPVAEELVYRGLLFKRMRENVPFKMAMIFSAVIFGVVHGNLVQFLYAGVIGLLLAYVYEKSGSFLVPVIMHIAMNITSVMATRLKLFEWMFQNIVLLGICTAAAAAVAAAIFVTVRNIEEN